MDWFRQRHKTAALVLFSFLLFMGCLSLDQNQSEEREKAGAFLESLYEAKDYFLFRQGF